MGNKSLELDWRNLLSGAESSPADVVVVPDGNRLSLEMLTDFMLDEKIARIRKTVDSVIGSRLGDQGKKLRANLRSLEEERDRRSRVPKLIDVKVCDLA